MDLQDLITGRIQQVEVPESLINKILHDHGLNSSVQISNGYIVLLAGNFTVEFFYHSHKFTNDNATVSFYLKRIKPLYYSFGLQLITKKYPFLSYWKDSDENKIITCYIDRVPGIDSILKDYKSCIDHIDIESVLCREGKVVIGLKTKADNCA